MSEKHKSGVKKRSLCWEMGKFGVKAIAGIYATGATVNFIVRWIETADPHYAAVDTVVRMLLILPIIMGLIMITITTASAGRAIEEALG